MFSGADGSQRLSDLVSRQSLETSTRIVLLDVLWEQGVLDEHVLATGTLNDTLLHKIERYRQLTG